FRADHYFFHTFQRRKIKHGVKQVTFHDGAQAAGTRLALDRLAGDGFQGVVSDRQLDVFHLEQALVLLDERILRLRQDLHQGFLVEILEGRDDRQTADELGDEPKLQQILRLDAAQDFAGAALVGADHLGREADRRAFAAPRDDLLEAGESAAADEEDVRRVDLQELLLRMLAAALRR